MRNKNIIIIAGATVILVAVLIVFIVNKLRVPTANAQSNQVAPSDLLKTAEELEGKQDLLSAKEMYIKFISEFPNDSRVSQAQKNLENLNVKLIFSPIATPDSFIYEVRPNDTLTKIAKSNNVTVDLIKRSNNLKSDTIRPGMQLKILKTNFNLFVDKSQNVLVLKRGEEIVKTYNVSTGKNNSTPTGKFTIVNKIADPVWFKSGAVVPPESPENILGSRWMGFDLDGYGIHGTTDPGTIGQQVTQGCIRMHNEEVEELFSILPIGTEAVIVD